MTDAPRLWTLYGQPPRHWRQSGYRPLVEPVALRRNLTPDEARQALKDHADDETAELR